MKTKVLKGKQLEFLAHSIYLFVVTLLLLRFNVDSLHNPGNTLVP